MIHIAAHFLVPVGVAAALYRPRWRLALVVFLATMLVDLDHLAADPIYDPDRCSIGFHPLHTAPAILFYAVLAALPLLGRKAPLNPDLPQAVLLLHLVGSGLLLHMGLDLLDCFVQGART